MTEPTAATPWYTCGFSEAMLRLLRGHTVHSHAAHLLPYLQPGQRALDFGCGPGTISVGIAKAIEPGELHGIDMKQAQIDLARSVAEAADQGNATFHLGDVINLPFDDHYFDIAHGHSILTYVPDTQAALAEVRRVLKPGGLISVREGIIGSSFLAPDFEILGDAWVTFAELITADGGHPHIGRDLKRHLLEAGFTDLRPTASYTSHTTPEEVAFFWTVIRDWFLSPAVREAATEYGVVSHRHLDNLERAFEQWRNHPGAFSAFAYGECLGSKPPR